MMQRLLLAHFWLDIHDTKGICLLTISAGWNNKNNPPLHERELRGVFDSIKSRQTSKNPRQTTSPYTVGTSVTQVGEENTPSFLSSKPVPLSELSMEEDPVVDGFGKDT